MSLRSRIMERISTASAQNRTTQTLVFGTIDHAIYCGWKGTLTCCPAAILRTTSSTNFSCKGGCLKIIPTLIQKKNLLNIIDLLIFEIQGSWILVKPWKFLRLLPLRPMFDSGSLSNLLRPRLSPWFPSQHPMGPTDNAKWLGATVASNSASP